MLHNPQHRPNIDQILRCEWLQHRPTRPQSPLHEARTLIQKRKKPSFWCTPSRKTSPLSPNHQPLKQTEVVECYTKKYNNVPVEKFKNPIDNDSSLSATTVIPIHNLSSTIQRNNSLINSSKVVRNQSIKNGSIEKTEIIQVRSYSQDDPLDETSLDGENKDYEKFMMNPTRTNQDIVLLKNLHPIEQSTRKIMGTLGINDELLEKNIEHGPRSEIIGIYRIIIMRLKTQISSESISQQQSPANNDKLNNHNHKLQKTKKHNATRCAIL